MHKLDLPVDYKEAAALQRRQNVENQRQSRIFNSKIRQIGIDVQAIEQQKTDKDVYESDERKRHEAFAADATRNDKIAQLLEARQDADARLVNMKENEFRAMHQQPFDRREWDIYDPDHLKKDKPARVHDDDPRCTLSGCQKFEGEDLNSKARDKFQKEQRREWAKAQKDEKDQADQNQKKAEELEKNKRIELDERAMALQRAEEDCKRAINDATAAYNKALANEQNERDRLKKQQEDDDNLTEIANNIYGDILTENPAVAQSAFGPTRVIPDRWKGMSPQQQEDVRNMQEIQRNDNLRRAEDDRLQNEEWMKQACDNAKAGMLLEREDDRQRRNVRKELDDENRRLAAEQKAHTNFMEKEVYTNPPTAAYFMQFNKTSR